jgi:hypothetical protein
MVKGGLHWIDVVFLFIQINKFKKKAKYLIFLSP